MGDFNYQVRKHDGNHLEIKTNIAIPEKGKGRYELNFYFFSPAQLRVNKKRIGINRALHAFLTYTRFSSPSLPLAAFTAAECTQSPLNRITSCLKQIEKTGVSYNDTMVYELQTLVNSFRGEARSFCELFESHIHQNPGDLELYFNKIKKSIKHTKKLLTELRSFFPGFLDQRIDDKTRTALSWADEALSNIANQLFLELHRQLKDIKLSNGILEELEIFIDNENRYRVERNYQSAITPSDFRSKELLAYRESILKKWTQSAMYMDVVESKFPETIGHILAGIAAAAAMAFALMAAFYAESFFVRNTTPWAIIIILSYVFKDRIKEILRDIFFRLLPRMAADRIDKLIEPRKKRKAGISQTIVRFSRETELPIEIKRIRDSGRNPFFSILPPQNVLHYHKYTSINGSLLRSKFSRHDSITEITRIDMDDYFKEMDDPENISYKLEESKRTKVKGARVYHVHLITVLREKSKKTSNRFFHHRIILNQEGILRVEPVV